MENGLVIAGLALPLIMSFLGWAYMLGFSNAKIGRNEKDIEKVNQDISECSRNEAVKTADFRKEMLAGFNKIYDKIDNLPCHNPKWNKEDC
jgi:hypothetical protein